MSPVAAAVGIKAAKLEEQAATLTDKAAAVGRKIAINLEHQRQEQDRLRRAESSTQRQRDREDGPAPVVVRGCPRSCRARSLLTRMRRSPSRRLELDVAGWLANRGPPRRAAQPAGAAGGERR